MEGRERGREQQDETEQGGRQCGRHVAAALLAVALTKGSSLHCRWFNGSLTPPTNPTTRLHHPETS